ncbi:hypothetical protein BEWA_020830 [Theileria equi strain WA]|uniref:Signal peptide-containing protein n=1 Tax=Theileria equi strain WA TaxID=1537102 RepID=L0AW27_THEEQ|nr:hypothetical protein BEWA_020830 [Theileria equi strain WA]AFZ79236.1 hypothetical protein BEWA_020830 [Theileria equi strain WA]|eukprot:XP_004828902.1 hypothetical protein BEWA_020830 [Theileria equi strain WA]
MRFAVVLYTISVLQFCRCHRNGNSSSTASVFDLSNVDESRINIDRSDEDGILYTPKPSAVLVKVVEGGKELWKTEKVNEKCTLANVYNGPEYRLIKLHIRCGLKSRFEYFKKKNERWVNATEQEFERLLEGIKKRITVTTTHDSNSKQEPSPKGKNNELGDPKGDKKEPSGDRSMGTSTETIVKVPDSAPLMEAVKTRSRSPKLIESKLDQSASGEMMAVKPKETKRKLRQKYETVDLAKPDRYTTNFYKATIHGVVNKSYFPRTNKFNKIVDSSKQVWTAKENQECTMACIYSKEGHPEILSISVKDVNEKLSKPTHFESVNGEWKSISEDDFNEKHRQMEEPKTLEQTTEPPKESVEETTVELKKESVIKMAPKEKETSLPVTIDIVDMDSKKINLSETTEHGITYKSLFPKSNDYIIKVQDDGMQVWKAKDGERCSMVYSTSNGNMMRLILNVSNGNEVKFEYFVKEEFTWRTVSQREYDAKFDEMKGNCERVLSQHYLNPVATFDISGINKALVSASKEISDNVTYKLFVPKDGMSFNKVVDGDVPIWTAYTGTVSPRIVSSSRGSSRLLTLYVIHNGDTIPKYFEKRSGMWTGISNKYFREKLERMKFDNITETILDLDNVNMDKVEVSAGLQDGLIYHTYEPKDGTVVTSIVQGNFTIWEISPDEAWKTCYSYSKVGSMIVTIIIYREGKAESRCFERVISGWRNISEDEFANKHSMMRSGQSLKTANRFIQLLNQGEEPAISESIGSSFVYHSIDVSTKPDENKITFYENTCGGVTHKTYSANNALVTEVVDSEVSIWHAKEGENAIHIRSLSFLNGTVFYYLDVESNGIVTPRCFEKADGGISSLDYKTYSDKVDAILNGEGIRLYVNTLTRNMCNFFRYVERGLLQIVIFPYKSRITSIYHGTHLWYSKTGEGCTSAHIYMGEDSYLAKITAQGGGYAEEFVWYFEHKDDKWEQITCSSFQDSLGLATENAIQSKPFGDLVDASMDLESVDTSTMTTYKYETSDFDKLLNVPLQDKRINKVTGGDQILWEAGNDSDRCLLSEIFSQGDYELLFINVKKESHLGFMYYEKIDGWWREISKQRYIFQYEAMNNGKFKNSVGSTLRNDTSKSSDLVSLDISKCNYKLYESFDYEMSENTVKLILPRSGISVEKLVYNGDEIYVTTPRETLEYAKVYLDGRKEPCIIVITSSISEGILEKYYLNNNGTWELFENYGDQINAFRVPVRWVSSFILDISTSKDAENFTFFETGMLGTVTRHFYPRPGYLVIEVKDEDQLLWKCSKAKSLKGVDWPFDRHQDCCIACIMYRNIDMELLELSVLESGTKKCKYFERSGGAWKSLKDREVAKKCIKAELLKGRMEGFQSIGVGLSNGAS